MISHDISKIWSSLCPSASYLAISIEQRVNDSRSKFAWYLLQISVRRGTRREMKPSNYANGGTTKPTAKRLDVPCWCVQSRVIRTNAYPSRDYIIIYKGMNMYHLWDTADKWDIYLLFYSNSTIERRWRLSVALYHLRNTQMYMTYSTFATFRKWRRIWEMKMRKIRKSSQFHAGATAATPILVLFNFEWCT